MKKKIISFFLATIFVLPLCSPALSAEGSVIDNGTCGDNLTWTLDTGYCLTISGSGDMYDYSDLDDVTKAPWTAYRDDIKSLIIESGVTGIGDFALYKCKSLKNITFSESLKAIGKSAFSGCVSLRSVKIPDNVETIEDSAFSGCSSLDIIVLPKILAYMGDYVFSGCGTHIDTVNYNRRVSKAVVVGKILNRPDNFIFYNFITEHIVLLDSITYIPENAYGSIVSEYLKSISIPKSITTVNSLVVKSFNNDYITDVYYAGSRADRQKMSIKLSELIPTRWYYNSYSTNPISVIFKDMKAGAWYENAVEYVYVNELFFGTGEDIFSPDIAMTRAMLVTVLYRMEGEPEYEHSYEFSDVDMYSDVWYKDAVLWALDKGIVSGYEDGTFRPDDSITREQIACILYQYAKYKGRDVSARADLSKFSDANKVSDWAYDAMSWANAEGFITGSDIGLETTGNATRAQVASILMRYCQKYS